MEKERISWKRMKKSPYLTSAAFNGSERIVLTIKRAEQNMSAGLAKNSDHNIIHFVEPGYKPMLVNTTNAVVIESLCGSEYIADWPGLMIELYTIDGIEAFGAIHDGVLRISRRKINAKPILDENAKNWDYTIKQLENKSTDWSVVENYYNVSEEIKTKINTIIDERTSEA